MSWVETPDFMPYFKIVLGLCPHKPKAIMVSIEGLVRTPTLDKKMFSLRGKEKVTGEFSLVSSANNILKIYNTFIKKMAA